MYSELRLRCTQEHVDLHINVYHLMIVNRIRQNFEDCCQVLWKSAKHFAAEYF